MYQKIAHERFFGLEENIPFLLPEIQLEVY
jgi:hypothetical protein